MTSTNIWVEKGLKSLLRDTFKKRPLDLIPAICNGKDGYCMISMTPEEIMKVLGAAARSVVRDSTGTMTAQLMGTDIIIDVVSITPI